MSGFKSAAKRKRELAKLDKRTAKDQKRAVRKAERAGAAVAPALPITATAQQGPANKGVVADTDATRKPLTLAEAVERWKTMKVGNPTTRPRGLSGKRN
jgi:hypothetical protein